MDAQREECLERRRRRALAREVVAHLLGQPDLVARVAGRDPQATPEPPAGPPAGTT